MRKKEYRQKLDNILNQHILTEPITEFDSYDDILRKYTKISGLLNEAESLLNQALTDLQSNEEEYYYLPLPGSIVRDNHIKYASQDYVYYDPDIKAWQVVLLSNSALYNSYIMHNYSVSQPQINKAPNWIKGLEKINVTTYMKKGETNED